MEGGQQLAVPGAGTARRLALSSRAAFSGVHPADRAERRVRRGAPSKATTRNRGKMRRPPRGSVSAAVPDLIDQAAEVALAIPAADAHSMTPASRTRSARATIHQKVCRRRL